MRLRNDDKPGTLLASYPDFDLSCRFDDADEPDEVTVFAGDTYGETLTEWLSTDADVAVPLEDVR